MIRIWIAHQEGIQPEDLGLLPMMLDVDCPDPARVQLDRGYRHGGGWDPFEGFTLNLKDLTLSYPGDPLTRPLAETQLRNERIILYEHAWVAIIQADGSFEVCRMD